MQDDNWKRGYIPQVSDVDYGGSIDQFIVDLTSPIGTGARPLKINYVAAISTALTVAFDAVPNDDNYYISLRGLEGCTSVVIIGEKGCWISHLWEIPWFEGYTTNEVDGVAKFQANIIAPIENGGGSTNPSPFAAGGQTARIPELGDGETGYKPEIRILTRAGANGGYAYDAQVRSSPVRSHLVSGLDHASEPSHPDLRKQC